MTNSLSPVDVCNMALSQIAVRTSITSISPSDGTVAGDACALLYQPTVDAFARRALELHPLHSGALPPQGCCRHTQERQRDDAAGPCRPIVSRRASSCLRSPSRALRRRSPPAPARFCLRGSAPWRCRSLPPSISIRAGARSRSSSPTSAPRSPDRRRSSTPAAWSTSGCGMRNFSWEQNSPSPPGWSIR